jgi:hypothetical protein
MALNQHIDCNKIVNINHHKPMLETSLKNPIYIRCKELVDLH